MKKKGIVIASIVALVLIVGITCIFDYYSNREKTRNEAKESLNRNKKKCSPFTGGSYTLKFETDGGTEIEDMSVCIACSPDSYKEIPIPEKEGFTFDGWYSDKKLTKKIDFTSTKDIKAIPEYDDDDCMIGYKDITLYANWSDVQLRVEEEENNNTVNSQPRSGGQPRGGNNSSQSSQETVPDYPMPPAHTTKVYRPINAGVLRGLYGRIEANSVARDLLFNISSDSDRYLYPINDGYVIKFYRSSYYTEIIYKTNIDGKDYFVRYYTYNNFLPARDYSDENNKIVSYNNPIAISPSGIFRMQMASADSGNPNVFYNNNLIVNPNMFLNLNKDEEFNER